MKKINKEIRRLIDIIEKYQDFILFTHINPDGDAIGSILGFYYFLLEIGKKPYIFLNSPIPSFYRFLLKGDVNTISNLDRSYNIGIVFDCSDIYRVKEDLNVKEKTKILINIDHHTSNSKFGDINIINEKASSVTEIIYDILTKSKFNISINVAACLLTGLITDTGSFRFSNTTPKSLKVASNLVKIGVDISSISKEIYEKRKLSSLKLLGISLLRINVDKDIAWSFINMEDMEKYNATLEDTEGIIDNLRMLKDVRVVVFFYPINEKTLKVSLRSKDNRIDVSKFAQSFGGGGHKEAAGFQVKNNNSDVYNLVINKLKEFIEENERISFSK
uniref:Bifunctional oligoribonuclease/PAP phosphatase NrnA n=1 Tax=Dictyoglomus thermophilum TaxID=14 RepID=A0A7C3RJA1_DICTH